jgi:poly(A) polymerase
LLRAILPVADQLAADQPAYRSVLLGRLVELDERRRAHGPLERSELITHLAGDYLVSYSPLADQKRIPFRDAYYEIKEFLKPVTPANKEVENAVNEIFRAKKRLLRSRSGA